MSYQIKEYQLKNNLKIFQIISNIKKNKSYAIFTIKFGSKDFDLNGNKQIDGIAHFLEHKLFDKKEFDYFEIFSKSGASVNAFTSFDKTNYLFSSTKDFKGNLNHLVDMVANPYFDQKKNKKEVGIIEQEIQMYNDDISWQGYFGIINNLYKNHNIKIDIAGDSKSIKQIKDTDLYNIYNDFYIASNMALFIASNEELDKELINKLEKIKDKKIKKVKNKVEDNTPYKKINSKIMDTPSIVYNYGLKISEFIDNANINYLYLTIFLDAFFSESNEELNELIKNGIIENNFNYLIDYSDDFFHIIFSGNVKNEKKINDLINQMFNFEVTKDKFDNFYKKQIGNFIYQQESLISFTNQISYLYADGINFEDYKKDLYSLDYNLFIKKIEIFKKNKENISLFVIKNK